MQRILLRLRNLRKQLSANHKEEQGHGEGSSSYEFYEDAGDGYGYESGKYTVTLIEK